MLKSQEYYFALGTEPSGFWVYHSDVKSPCDIIDSVYIEHTFRYEVDDFFGINISVEDRYESSIVYFIDYDFDINIGKIIYFYAYDKANDTKTELGIATISPENNDNINDFQLISDNKFAITLPRGIYIYDVNTDSFTDVTTTLSTSEIFECNDNYFTLSGIFNSQLYSWNPENYETSFLRNFWGSNFNDVATTTDCFGYCEKDWKLLVIAGSLSQEANKIGTVRYESLERTELCDIIKTRIYQSNDIIDFHFLLDLNTADDVCEDTDVYFNQECETQVQAFTEAEPGIIVTSEHIDSMEVYIQGGSADDILYLSDATPPTITVVGQNTNKLTFYNQGSATVDDFETVIPFIVYENVGNGEATIDLDVVFQLYDDRFESKVAIAHIRIVPDDVALAGEDSVTDYCYSDGEVNLSTLLSVDATTKGSWDPTVSSVIPSQVYPEAVYRYIVSGQNGCNSDTSLHLLRIGEPPSAVERDTSLCFGDSIQVLDTWVSTSSELNFTIQDVNGCDSIELTYRVHIGPPPELETESYALCEGDTLSLYGEQVSSEGIYDFMVQSSLGCDSVIRQVEVTVQLLPALAIVGEAVICGPTEVDLLAETDEVVSYQWSTGEEVDQISVGTGGGYSVTVTDSNGCSRVAATEVMFSAGPSITGTQQYTVNQNNGAQIILTVSDYEDISWDPTTGLSCTDCLDPIVVTTTDMVYTVTLTDADGCMTTYEIMVDYAVEIDEATDLVMPNIINPASLQSANRYLSLQSSIVDSYDLWVYDRWGNEVYAGEGLQPGPSAGWDGSMAGRQVLSGVYVYRLVYRAGELTGTKYGDVTVVR